MKIAVINGPNINFIGIREPDIYGKEDYNSLVEKIKKHCDKANIDVDIFQSNHEGSLVDKIQECYRNTDGIVINPGAYTHTSVALLDALKSVNIPAVEVHISDVSKREEFRQISYIRSYCLKTITGKGFDGYTEAIDFLRDIYESNN